MRNRSNLLSSNDSYRLHIDFACSVERYSEEMCFVVKKKKKVNPEAPASRPFRNALVVRDLSCS